jgi:hypothetical protein
MSNCYFCEHSLKGKYEEGIEKTNTKTSCCKKFYCRYHENDLFVCSSCNRVYCYFEDCNGNNINKCNSNYCINYS